MDTLATVADLRTLLDEDETGLSDDAGTLLLELATSAVQAAAGQRILQATETVTLMGAGEQWFQLPQLPVTDVAAVAVDGQALVAGTDYKRFGARLWRRCGWSSCSSEPSEVTVTYTHGYADWDGELGLAREATLTIAARMFTNPAGATGLSIDDFSQQFSQSNNSDVSGLIPDRLRAALRRKYGRRGGLVRVG
ncbi:MAG TPA: hypothetical protein VG497_05730 [Kribbella sp.]|nr:hypothetical protein [Kribbella sp.]